MKKFIISLLTIAITISIAGCGRETNTYDFEVDLSTSTSTPESTPTPTPTPKPYLNSVKIDENGQAYFDISMSSFISKYNNIVGDGSAGNLAILNPNPIVYQKNAMSSLGVQNCTFYDVTNPTVSNMSGVSVATVIQENPNQKVVGYAIAVPPDSFTGQPDWELAQRLLQNTFKKEVMLLTGLTEMEYDKLISESEQFLYGEASYYKGIVFLGATVDNNITLHIAPGTKNNYDNICSGMKALQ